MRALDIVDQLAKRVPLFTSGFSETVGLTSITVAGTVATATTAAAHNIAEGENVAILGADAPVQIDTGTFLRTGTFAVFETIQAHDITLSQRDKDAGGKTLTISGATEPEFNGTFQISSVPNRNKLIINVADAGPTTISGSPIVENANGEVFNGLVPAYNVTANTFDYDLPYAYPLNAVISSASVQTSIRIASAVDIDQFVTDIYTKQNLGDDMLIVQLGDVVASKKRNEESDASASTSGEYSYTPILLQPFAIYVIMNVTDQLDGAAARDKVESEYIPAIFKSVLRAKFATGFTYDQFRATFTGHGTIAYSSPGSKGKALYVHEITFEQLITLTKVDMAPIDENVAMRDIDYTINTNLGTGSLSASINLDDEPQ